MPALGQSQLPVVMPTYPHFLAGDTDVWTKYLQAPVVPIAEVWYDVHVGTPIELTDFSDEMDRRIALGVSRKRIDVVARIGNGYWIIEVKPIADMKALGQIINYTGLFRRDFSVPGEIIPVIICDEVDVNVMQSFDEFGVVVIVN